MTVSAFMTQASTHAAHIDRLFYALTAISFVIAFLVFALVIGFSFRYYRGSKAKRGRMPHIMRNEFEIGWSVATLFLFLFIFWWAASAQLSALTPPQRCAANPRRRQAVDVEDPAAQRRARDQRAACPDRASRWC